MTPHHIAALCESCAAAVYGHRAPTPAYARRAAMLLLGTAATESHLIYPRQKGLPWDRDIGAWGLWQTEGAAVRDSVSLLHRHEPLRERALAWAGADWRAVLGVGTSSLLRCIAVSPRLACLFARLHYYRFAEPIPEGAKRQARYWKRYYNTSLGAGTPEKYLRDWERIALPLVEGGGEHVA